MLQIKITSQRLKLKLNESIDKFIVSLGESKVGNIHKDEIAIAKKLRAHIDQNAN